MIVDTSAVVAILRREPGHESLISRLQSDLFVGIGAPTMVEAGMVLTARAGPPGKSLLDRLVREADITLMPFTAAHWSVAVDAFARYGRGHHPAKLNFGDCLTYAVASVSGQPLLCVGDDFPQTDLELVR